MEFNTSTLTSSLFLAPLPLWPPPPLHHISVQVANFALFLFFVIFFKNPKNKVLPLLILIYSGCQMYWAWAVLRGVDLFIWSGAVGLALILRGLWWVLGICGCAWGSGRRMDREVEKVYSTLFAPLQITPAQFSRILSCRRKQLKILKVGEYYAREKVTRVDSLGVVLSGRLLVTQSSRPLHIIHPNQFVDSPEYFGVSTDDLFQVTITAVEESRLLVWHRDKLRLCISNGLEDGYLREMFDHVIGRDVVRKLVQVSDSSVLDKKPVGVLDTTPVPVMEEEEEALVDKADQEDPELPGEGWSGSLGKIAEEETVV